MLLLLFWLLLLYIVVDLVDGFYFGCFIAHVPVVCAAWLVVYTLLVVLSLLLLVLLGYIYSKFIF
jgi:hypothetical protein